MAVHHVAASSAVRSRVLIADDDDVLTEVLKTAFEQAGYEVEVAHDGLQCLRQLYQWRPDLVILDVVMPRLDGWETCRRIREVSDVPILMLTAKGGASNELMGLEYGADMYMSKPFTVPLLLARADALLRWNRSRPTGPDQTVVTLGDLSIDLTRHEVSRGGQSIDLTATEFRVLAALAARPGETVPHQQILAQVWGPEYTGEDQLLKLYVHYLREKIEEEPGKPRYILTKRGVGYYLNSPAPSPRALPLDR